MLRTTVVALLLCFLASPLCAQTLGTWKTYPAYSVCTRNIPVGHRVYALMEQRLMAYDTDDQSIHTWDNQNGLNDVAITFLAHSEEAQRLIIVYDNGNIDLLSTQDDNDVINLAHLKKSNLQGKEVAYVSVHGKTAYLAMGFGLMVIDMAEGIIENTYQLGFGVTACASDGTYILAGASDGVWRGRIGDNLQDKANWTHINSSILSPTEMVDFDSHVFVLKSRTLHVINATSSSFTAQPLAFTPSYLTVSDGCLLVGNDTQLELYTAWDTKTTVTGSFTWSWLTRKGQHFWASDGSDGLQSYTLTNGGFTLETQQLHPNSPLHDYTYHLRFAGDRLLVAGGPALYKVVWYPGTAMYMEADGTWVNFESRSAEAADPECYYRNVTDIAQDPNDPAHHYVSTTFFGLYEFRDGKCVKHHSIDNSPLRSILPESANPKRYTVGNGAQYDSEGNLWVMNSTEGANDTIVRILRPNGTWTGLRNTVFGSATALDNMLFDSRGWVWLSSRRTNDRGIVCLDYNGTLTSQSDDRCVLRDEIINQDGTSYRPDEFYGMAEDRDGHIWIGTNLGPFLINDPEAFLGNDFRFEQVKVSRNDGSGLADYLLTGIPVNAIAVDGGNRKWFATQNNGIYLVSADCQEEIYHFTTENSPLLSDNVNDIAINHQTGLVMIATDRGLCSFMADATQPEESLSSSDVYAYPNPVEPSYNGPIVVRGLVADSEVKILTSTGQLVWSGTSTGGTFTWNGCNRSGRRVASGIYNVVASTPEGNKAVVCKIAFIR